jgi:nitroreductase
MTEMLKLIEERHSVRVPFDRERPIAKGDLRQILEAARWAPTAHNMQNFEIVVVDDQDLLDQIGTIQFQPSEAFLRENFQVLSFSEEELRQKKIGILGTMVPPSLRDSARLKEGAREPIPLHRLMPDCPALLILLYDARKRAPASEGDVLGMMSLGCVLENIWLMVHSLGLGLQVMDVFSMPSVEPEIKSLLAIPPGMKMAIAARLGYPIATPGHYLRVRREMEEFTHQNRFSNKDTDERLEGISTP